MMNRIIVGLGVGLLFGLTQSTDAQQQKKALDINACMAWKRVDSPEISSTGRWVMSKSLFIAVPKIRLKPKSVSKLMYLSSTCFIRDSFKLILLQRLCQ